MTDGIRTFYQVWPYQSRRYFSLFGDTMHRSYKKKIGTETVRYVFKLPKPVTKKTRCVCAGGAVVFFRITDLPDRRTEDLILPRLAESFMDKIRD